MNSFQEIKSIFRFLFLGLVLIGCQQLDSKDKPSLEEKLVHEILKDFDEKSFFGIDSTTSFEEVFKKYQLKNVLNTHDSEITKHFTSTVCNNIFAERFDTISLDSVISLVKFNFEFNDFVFEIDSLSNSLIPNKKAKIKSIFLRINLNNYKNYKLLKQKIDTVLFHKFQELGYVNSTTKTRGKEFIYKHPTSSDEIGRVIQKTPSVPYYLSYSFNSPLQDKLESEIISKNDCSEFIIKGNSWSIDINSTQPYEGESFCEPKITFEIDGEKRKVFGQVYQNSKADQSEFRYSFLAKYSGTLLPHYFILRKNSTTGLMDAKLLINHQQYLTGKAFIKK